MLVSFQVGHAVLIGHLLFFIDNDNCSIPTYLDFAVELEQPVIVDGQLADECSNVIFFVF